jgi:hypothetical protein
VLGAEKEATPINYLDQLDFKVSGSGGEVAYLEGDGDQYSREVAFFFLPQIDPGESEPRTLKFTYTWPGMMTKLIQDSEEISWVINSRREVGEVLFEFFYEPSLGVISCEQIHAPIKDVKPIRIQDAKDWPGWQYKLTDAPAELRYKLEFARKNG